MGTLFRLSPDTGLQMLLSFGGTNGARPSGSFLQAADGTLFGTTQFGGLHSDFIGTSAHTILYFTDYGTVFKITPDGTFSKLFAFDLYTNGGDPSGLVRGSDGNFYGTTQWSGGAHTHGTVFKVTPAGQLTTLLSFNGTNGAVPTASLVLGADGNLYGTTSAGGTSYIRTNAGFGTVFRLTLPPPVPQIQSAQQVGQTLILTWTAVPGRSYQLELTPSLAQTNWVATGNAITATNYTATGSKTIGPDPQQFYRVQLLP
jgi:uncharacterized repeat protein (TIGR03803 family)